ncbi:MULTISPECIES: hypothetical protein [unclassified Stenotrophomonas]|uniref:hypothetical protein n=1 Tax=unclassified Stenotrophomonas TaxID=196198 RepID=UPI0021177A69|nr:MULTISPECIES: hypothetical protein [unclassified Stenotrophomonas]
MSVAFPLQRPIHAARSDTLGWVIARRTGKPVSTLLSERIWQRLGPEQDAYYTVDSTGTPFAGGGFNAGLHDLARPDRQGGDCPLRLAPHRRQRGQ